MQANPENISDTLYNNKLRDTRILAKHKSEFDRNSFILIDLLLSMTVKINLLKLKKNMSSKYLLSHR